MSWTDIEERIAPKSKFDASVRLYQRGAAFKPALIIALRTSLASELKWKPIDAFGLALGGGDVAGKVRIIRRKTKTIAKPRQMKTGALSFDFGHVPQFGERGTLKAEAIAVMIDADTVEVTIPEFAYEDEQEEEEPEQESVPHGPAAAPIPASSRPGSLKPSGVGSIRAAAAAAHRVVPPANARKPPVTIAGITIRFEHDNECVSFRQKTMEVTDQQANVIATLAKAMPQPVGREFIIAKVFNWCSREAASLVLDQVYMDLSKALPGIGLQIKNVKGVGFALSEAA